MLLDPPCFVVIMPRRTQCLGFFFVVSSQRRTGNLPNQRGAGATTSQRWTGGDPTGITEKRCKGGIMLRHPSFLTLSLCLDVPNLSPDAPRYKAESTSREASVSVAAGVFVDHVDIGEHPIDDDHHHQDPHVLPLIRILEIVCSSEERASQFSWPSRFSQSTGAAVAMRAKNIQYEKKRGGKEEHGAHDSGGAYSCAARCHR